MTKSYNGGAKMTSEQAKLLFKNEPFNNGSFSFLLNVNHTLNSIFKI